MIEQISYLDRQLNFATQETAPFRHLFPFGSLNLLIGINGSGKTSMLLKVAEIISRGLAFGDQGNYSVIDNEGIQHFSDASYKAEGYGVVYYTSLPYRRKIRNNQCFIDASKKDRKKNQSMSIEYFRRLSGLLGTETQLTARVEYREDIVEKLIVPYLLESEIQLQDHYMQQDLDVLRKFTLNSESKNTNNDTLYVENSEISNQEMVDRRVHFSNHFKSKLFSALDANGLYYRISSLASLQKTIFLTRDTQNLIHYLLKEINLVKNDYNYTKNIPVFNDMRNTTFRYLVNENGDISDLKYAEDWAAEFQLYSDNLYEQLLISNTSIEFHWENLSSGLFALIEQFSNIDNAVRRLARSSLKKIVLLIDEGDAFLHLDWQRKYIKLLNDFLMSLTQELNLVSVQVLIASHSPLLAGDVPRCMVQNLGKNFHDVKTFGAPLDDIVLQCFHSNSIGEFAAGVIRSIFQRAQNSRLTQADYLLIDEIGDPAIKHAILNGSQDLNGN